MCVFGLEYSKTIVESATPEEPVNETFYKTAAGITGFWEKLKPKVSLILDFFSSQNWNGSFFESKMFLETGVGDESYL